MQECLEVLTDKSKDNYKIIEDRYLTLKFYLINFFQQNDVLLERDVELILNSLEKMPIKKVTENEYKG
ncbi:MAG: hypothetical protein IJV15_00015 [Lachnospiraceae bacterium]|nr:hypothetical protein [Lachnospiraceae bacterium]